VAALFAEDAVYWYGPFREATRGRDAIVRQWVDGGLGEDFDYTVEPLAVTGLRGIAHWTVAFGDPATNAAVELDGVLVLEFDDDGRCTEHREWYLSRETPKEEP
jgi:SnoaL-like protein